MGKRDRQTKNKHEINWSLVTADHILPRLACMMKLLLLQSAQDTIHQVESASAVLSPQDLVDSGLGGGLPSMID